MNLKYLLVFFTKRSFLQQKQIRSNLVMYLNRNYKILYKLFANGTLGEICYAAKNLNVP